MTTKTKTKETTDMTETKDQLPAVSIFEDDAGAGLEGTDKTSFAIPFLTMLQGLSPACENVDGAKPGLIINSITNELFKTVRIIPCAFQRRFIRWAPRTSGNGGFKGEYSPADVETGSVEGMSVIDGRYLIVVPEGAPAFDKDGRPLYDILEDTRMHFVLFENAAGFWQPALISLRSTQIKHSKRFMSRIKEIMIKGAKGTFNPPSYSHIYTVSGLKEKNAKGEWWSMDFNIERMLNANDQDELHLYSIAKEFNKSVNSGQIEVNHNASDEHYQEQSESNKF